MGGKNIISNSPKQLLKIVCFVEQPIKNEDHFFIIILDKKSSLKM